MWDEGVRRLAVLIAERGDLPLLTDEIDEYPLEERADLCRYAWGLSDEERDPEREASLWLYAWALDAKQKERRGGVATLEPYD